VSSTATRQTILEAARELLERDQWSGVGLADVARDAGVSRQAIYLHFGSRSALLLALVDWVDEAEGLGDLVARVDEAPTGAAALDELVALNAAVVVAHDAARRSDADLEAAWQDRMRHRRALYRRVAIRLEAEGVLALPRDEAVDLVWALLGSRVHEDLVVARGWSRKRYEQRMRALLRTALLEGG